MKYSDTFLQFPPEFSACPEGIRTTIQKIADEPTTKSIWFIGSRANSQAKPDSDWDIMVFCRDEIVRVPARITGLDVLRVSPAGQVLLEGKSEHFILQFSRFRWSQGGRDHAIFEGQRFRTDNSPRDYSESAVEVYPCRALLIYEERE